MTGLDIIRAIQSIHSDGLDKFWLFVTDLHGETLYFLVLPLLLWLYDKRFARYMTSVFLLGYWFNGALKELFNTPRPTSDQVRVVRPEGDGAFPSGHAMNPLTFWGAMALQVHKTWLSVALGVLVFAIGFSRLYLGVHWPLDVLGGWAIGAVMLFLFEWSRSFWVGQGMSLAKRLFWAIMIPAIIFLLTFHSPAAGNVYVIVGAYLGFWVGSILEEEFVGFDPRRGPVGFQLVKVLAGIVMLLAIKEGFKLFLPHGGWGDLVRYFCVTFTGAYIGPWLFHRFAPGAPAGRTLAR